jgi:hypothetical protein
MTRHPLDASGSQAAVVHYDESGVEYIVEVLAERNWYGDICVRHVHDGCVITYGDGTRFTPIGPIARALLASP